MLVWVLDGRESPADMQHQDVCEHVIPAVTIRVRRDSRPDAEAANRRVAETIGRELEPRAPRWLHGDRFHNNSGVDSN